MSVELELNPKNKICGHTFCFITNNKLITITCGFEFFSFFFLNNFKSLKFSFEVIQIMFK